MLKLNTHIPHVYRRQYKSYYYTHTPNSEKMRLFHKEYLIQLLEFWLYLGKILHHVCVKHATFLLMGEVDPLNLILKGTHEINELCEVCPHGISPYRSKFE